ncbi:MAG: ANTAR domain-containing protein [Treponema sp.]|nr:ANTAR domain-containing protein [Treponema sp.]
MNMERALVITSTDKGFSDIAEMLRAHSVIDITYVRSGGEGRRLLLERLFDLVIISSPLSDETGENLARQIAVSGVSQVILAVKSDLYDSVSAACEKDSVLTIAKPINNDIFRQVLSIAKTMRTWLVKVRSENEDLKQKIDNIRIIDRAKSILISSTRMSEHEAHRHIEKMAMDTRTSKRKVSERIIHDYENGP